VISIGSTKERNGSVRKLKYRRIKKRGSNFVEMHLRRYSERGIYTLLRLCWHFLLQTLGKKSYPRERTTSGNYLETTRIVNLFITLAISSLHYFDFRYKKFHNGKFGEKRNTGSFTPSLSNYLNSEKV
jgi:hypothetical protein